MEVLTQGTNWHSVLVPSYGKKGSPDRALNFTGTPEAVIFCGAFASVTSLAEELGAFQVPDAERPRLVAVLADPPRGGDFGVLLEAQRRLRSAGADDVLLAAGEPCDVRLAVALCLARLRHEDARRQQAEQSVGAQIEQLLLQQSMQARSREGQNELFWQHAHQLYATFPEPVPGIAKEPKPEAKIGPCQLGSALGQGAFGQVYEALNTETREVEAVKAVPKHRLSTSTEVHRLNKELQALGRLDHRNIVKLHGVLHGPHHIFMRLEVVGKHTLGQLLQAAKWGLKPAVARNYQAQLLSALSHCHAQGIAHRDLKPENIAVSGCGQQLKLLAFGFAAVSGQPCHSPVGSMPFTSPEMLQMSEGKGYEPAGCDVWASGVVLVEMLCGRGKMSAMMGWPANVAPASRCGAELAAFFGRPGVFEAALQEDLNDVSEHLLLLLRGSLEVEPARRWTAAQAEACEWWSSGRETAGGRAHLRKAAVPCPLPAVPAGPRHGGSRLPTLRE